VPDPNWLLSTSAQSAAAIVAIIGGFLVSRLVTMSAERNGLLRRREEIDALAAIKRGERGQLLSEDEADEAVGLISDALDDLIEAEGDMSLETLLQDHGDPWDKPTDSLRFHLDRANETIKQASAQLEPTMKAEAQRPQRSFRSFARAHGVKYEEWQEYVYEAVYRRIRDEIPRPPSSGFSGIGLDPEDIVMPSFERMPTIVRGPSVPEKIEILASELRALDAERSNIESQLGRMARPSGIGRGIAILAYFAGIGIAFPVSLLPVTNLNTLVRLAVVLGFISGLALVIGYLIWLTRSLSRDRAASSP